MSILKSGGSPPFSPSPGHVIVGRSWKVVAGPGGSWRVILAGLHVGDLPLLTSHFRGGGGRLGLPSCWLPLTQGIKVFCLILLNYLTSGLYSCLYSPLDTALLFGVNTTIG
jgi:hypothetical protein